MKPTGLMKFPTFGDLRLCGLKRGNNEKRVGYQEKTDKC